MKNSGVIGGWGPGIKSYILLIKTSNAAAGQAHMGVPPRRKPQISDITRLISGLRERLSRSGLFRKYGQKRGMKGGRLCLSVLTVLVSLWLLQRLLVPKYADAVAEGALIAAYYEEEKDFDVIFFGDCEVYESFSPAVLWEEYGINSYIRGSAQQYIWQSYYLLEDTLRYETPKVAVFNVLSLRYSEAQREAYNRMTLEGMEWSLPKIKSILASMKEEEHFLDYVFPILRYHSRWSELTDSDLRYLFDRKQVFHNGYYMHVEIRAARDISPGKPPGNYRFGPRAWKYLDKMAALCEEKGIELVLIKAPSLSPFWYREWEEQVEAYAAAHGLRYINFLERQEETGIDYAVDTYDRGLHLNLSGAEKLSRYFGGILSRDLGVSDRRGEAHLQEIWQEKLAAYEAEKRRQYGQYGIHLYREQLKHRQTEEDM
nr:SGNH/GDSL hydrolase family protein [uncultured Acetatifactor sp.]